MLAFEWIIGLLLGAVLLSALARRLQVPYPTFLAIGGMLLAFVPSGPSWTLEPDLALALFVAPVLLDAAFDTSLRDLRNNWLPVSTLVFIAVGLTTASVAVLVHWLLPDMPWPAAIALGASRRPMRQRQPRSCARSSCPTGCSRSSKAKACSMTPARC